MGPKPRTGPVRHACGSLSMRAVVLSGDNSAWVTGPRSAAKLKEAAKHYERAAAECGAPAGKVEFARLAVLYRSKAEAM